MNCPVWVQKPFPFFDGDKNIKLSSAFDVNCKVSIHIFSNYTFHFYFLYWLLKITLLTNTIFAKRIRKSWISVTVPYIVIWSPRGNKNWQTGRCILHLHYHYNTAFQKKKLHICSWIMPSWSFKKKENLSNKKNPIISFIPFNFSWAQMTQRKDWNAKSQVYKYFTLRLSL